MASRAEAAPSDSSPPTETQRIIVVLLPFEDRTGDPNLAPWRYMAPGLLRNQLSHLKALRLRSEGAVRYGLQQARLSPGDAVDPNHARIIGEHIEAQRVIWGNYSSENERLRVEVRLLNVATSELSGPFVAAGIDGFDLREALNEEILRALGVTATQEERREMARRWTSSAETLTWYDKGYMLQEQGRPVAEIETCLRRALRTDPNCVPVLVNLAGTLANRGQFGPAEDLARRALQLDEEDPDAYAVLGYILGSQRRLDEAKDALRQSCRLDRDDADHLALLARVYAVEGRWEEVKAFLQMAVSLEPTNAAAYASLAEAHVVTKDEPAALVAMNEAAHFMPERIAALEVHLRLAETYERLEKAAEALEHYTQIVVLSTQLGMNPAMIRSMEGRVRRLEGRLAPSFIEASMPRRYSEQDVDTILSERLDKAERHLVGNPFACTDAMRQWAQELTRDATTDTDKARAIFRGLAARPWTRGQAKSRIAREVFAAWGDPKVRLVCMDHAVLFVALARAVGIDASFAQITRDSAGIVMNHACAAIFDGDRAYLADSSLRWFGVPHQEYAILDDVQAAAFLCFYNEPREGDPLSAHRAGLKAWPDSIQGRLALANLLLQREQPEEARQILEDVEAPTSEGFEASTYWMAHGLLAESEGDLERAEDLLRKAVTLCSTQAAPYLRLGRVCLRRGRLAEARAAFRDSLRNDSSAIGAGLARHLIAQINEKIGYDVSPVAEPPESKLP
jgi:tetratricopeptide (TPR) repeat protein